jgi:hypothetical protein
MAPPLRIEFPGAHYHVTSRGNARQRVFRDDEDRAMFLATLGRGKGDRGEKGTATVLVVKHALDDFSHDASEIFRTELA